MILVAFLCSVVYALSSETGGARLWLDADDATGSFELGGAHLELPSCRPSKCRHGAWQAPNVSCSPALVEDPAAKHAGPRQRCGSPKTRSWMVLPFAFLAGGLLNVETFTKCLPIVL